MSAVPAVRPMTADDLERVAAIQAAAPEGAQWHPADYLSHSAFVVELDGRVAGFAVARLLPAPVPDEAEAEVLNVAVAPESRRRGLGTAMMEVLLALPCRFLYLEVRASNAAAIALYERLGFIVSGRRRDYYPPLQSGDGLYEYAIVMKMQKW